MQKLLLTLMAACAGHSMPLATSHRCTHEHYDTLPIACHTLPLSRLRLHPHTTAAQLSFVIWIAAAVGWSLALLPKRNVTASMLLLTADFLASSALRNAHLRKGLTSSWPHTSLSHSAWDTWHSSMCTGRRWVTRQVPCGAVVVCNRSQIDQNSSPTRNQWPPACCYVETPHVLSCRVHLALHVWQSVLLQAGFFHRYYIPGLLTAELELSAPRSHVHLAALHVPVAVAAVQALLLSPVAAVSIR